MKPVFVRSLSRSGTYLRKKAQQIALALLSTSKRHDAKIIDGYLVKAQRSVTGANVLIMDTPGFLTYPGVHRLTLPTGQQPYSPNQSIPLKDGRDFVLLDPPPEADMAAIVFTHCANMTLLYEVFSGAEVDPGLDATPESTFGSRFYSPLYRFPNSTLCVQTVLKRFTNPLYDHTAPPSYVPDGYPPAFEAIARTITRTISLTKYSYIHAMEFVVTDPARASIPLDMSPVTKDAPARVHTARFYAGEFGSESYWAHCDNNQIPDWLGHATAVPVHVDGETIRYIALIPNEAIKYTATQGEWRDAYRPFTYTGHELLARAYNVVDIQHRPVVGTGTMETVYTPLMRINPLAFGDPIMKGVTSADLPTANPGDGLGVAEIWAADLAVVSKPSPIAGDPPIYYALCFTTSSVTRVFSGLGAPYESGPAADFVFGTRVYTDWSPGQDLEHLQGVGQWSQTKGYTGPLTSAPPKWAATGIAVSRAQLDGAGFSTNFVYTPSGPDYVTWTTTDGYYDDAEPPVFHPLTIQNGWYAGNLPHVNHGFTKYGVDSDGTTAVAIYGSVGGRYPHIAPPPAGGDSHMTFYYDFADAGFAHPGSMHVAVVSADADTEEYATYPVAAEGLFYGTTGRQVTYIGNQKWAFWVTTNKVRYNTITGDPDGSIDYYTQRFNAVMAVYDHKTKAVTLAGEAFNDLLGAVFDSRNPVPGIWPTTNPYLNTVSQVCVLQQERGDEFGNITAYAVLLACTHAERTKISFDSGQTWQLFNKKGSKFGATLSGGMTWFPVDGRITPVNKVPPP